VLAAEPGRKTTFMFEDKKTFPLTDGMGAAQVSAAGWFGFQRTFAPFRDMSGQRGKENSKTTDTLQAVPLGRFQRFFCKPVAVPDESSSKGIDMLAANRRRSERHVCRRIAKIQFGTGSLPRDCTITDVSDGGVKVIAEYPDIPSEFTIILTTGHPRQCRLAWRIGYEFGAQFID
jgi:hypothetical protein